MFQNTSEKYAFILLLLQVILLSVFVIWFVLFALITKTEILQQI